MNLLKDQSGHLYISTGPLILFVIGVIMAVGVAGGLVTLTINHFWPFASGWKAFFLGVAVTAIGAGIYAWRSI